jgi:hypothetical protein
MAKQTFTTGQVLTAAQMTSLQQTAMLGGAASAKTVSYTLVAADAGTAISMSSASATTITVNTALFAAGDTVQITNLGVGICTITAGTATVNSSASLALAQYESGTLDFTSTSAAIFIKGAGAAAASGGMTLISEQVASANSSISFSSIAGTYKQLLLVWSGIYHSATNSSFALRFNNDGTSSPYRGFSTGMVGATGYGTSGQQSSQISMSAGGYTMYSFGENANFSSSDLNAQVNGQILIDNYASSTKLKYFNTNYGYYLTGDNKYLGATFTGAYNSTTAITSLDIVRTGGTATISNSTNTSIRLYGIS